MVVWLGHGGDEGAQFGEEGGFVDREEGGGVGGGGEGVFLEEEFGGET